MIDGKFAKQKEHILVAGELLIDAATGKKWIYADGKFFLSKVPTRNEVKQDGMATVTPKPISPIKRIRTAMRVAKFYAGMTKELQDGVDGDYARLLQLWGDPEDQGGPWHGYPWVPPSPSYRLPKTEKEFNAEYDAAFVEFDAMIARKQGANMILYHVTAKTNLPSIEREGLKAQCGSFFVAITRNGRASTFGGTKHGEEHRRQMEWCPRDRGDSR